MLCHYLKINYLQGSTLNVNNNNCSAHYCILLIDFTKNTLFLKHNFPLVQQSNQQATLCLSFLVFLSLKAERELGRGPDKEKPFSESPFLLWNIPLTLGCSLLQSDFWKKTRLVLYRFQDCCNWPSNLFFCFYGCEKVKNFQIFKIFKFSKFSKFSSFSNCVKENQVQVKL